MRFRPVLLLALLAGAPGAARAAGPHAASAPDEEGILFGVRGAWGLPFGDVAPGAKLTELAKTKLPLWLEVGYRFNGYFRTELYFELAPMKLADACPSGAACSAFDVRSGIELQIHPSPRSWLDPWLGVGFGIEYLQATTPPPGSPAAWELSWYGLEVPVEVGLDLAFSDVFTLGPHASVSFAQFTSASAKPPGGSTVSGASDTRATHGWGQAGLKMTLKL